MRSDEGKPIWSETELERLGSLQGHWAALQDVESETERDAIFRDAKSRLHELTTMRAQLQLHTDDLGILEELRPGESAMFACHAVISAENAK